MCNTDNAKPGLLVGEIYIAKSVTVTIPVATLDSLTIGSLRILFLNMICAASSTVAVGFAVISGFEGKLSSDVGRRWLSHFFANPLTRSLSVIILKGLPCLVTITLPTSFSVIKAAASPTVFEISMDTTLLDIIFSKLVVLFSTKDCNPSD